MNLSMLFFLVLLASLCKSDDYIYDDYKYDDYNYDRNYDYHNQESDDYTDGDDYNQDLNDYYGHQNLLAPFIPPPPPPTPPPPPMDFNSCINNWCHQKGTMGQYTRCKSVSNNGRTCHNPEIKSGSAIGGKPGGAVVNTGRVAFAGTTIWCKQLFPATPKMFGTVQYKVTSYLAIFILKVS